MGHLMYMLRQGDIADAKKINRLEELILNLEKRVEMLENVAKPLQSEQRPRLGRPPKVKDEHRQTEVDTGIGD